jgi:hypothetical protein
VNQLITCYSDRSVRLGGSRFGDAVKIIQQHNAPGVMRMRRLLRIRVTVLVAALTAALGLVDFIADGALRAALAQDLTVEFHDTLRSYGRWVEHPRWGAAWIPVDVPPDWRPYRFGHWVYTEEWGWYWVSDEEWGWITYHYGRWLWDRDLGWFWIPGNDWGPAWVSWRRGDDVVGWAPMPPDDYDIDAEDEPHFWSFVRPADVIAPSVASVVLPAAQVSVSIHQTVFINPTIVVREQDRVVVANPGVPPAIIAAQVGHPLQTVAVQPHVMPGTAGVAGAIVGAPTKGGGVRDIVKPQAAVIEPVAHVPPPTAYRPGAPLQGPHTPKVLQHINLAPPSGPAARPPSPLPPRPGAPSAINPHPTPIAPTEPSPGEAPGGRAPGPSQMMRTPPHSGAEHHPPPPAEIHVPAPATPAHVPAPAMPTAPRPPVVTDIHRAPVPPPPPPHPPAAPAKNCALVNGQQVCR